MNRPSVRDLALLALGLTACFPTPQDQLDRFNELQAEQLANERPALAKQLRAANAEKFDRRPGDLEAWVTEVTKGFAPLGAAAHGDLAHPAPIPLGMGAVNANTCAVIVLRLDPGAALSEDAKTWDVDVSLVNGPNLVPHAMATGTWIGPGAVVDAGCRSIKWSPEVSLQLDPGEQGARHGVTMAGFGKGGFSVQVFKRDLSAAEIATIRQAFCTNEYDRCLGQSAARSRPDQQPTPGWCLDTRELCMSRIGSK